MTTWLWLGSLTRPPSPDGVLIIVSEPLLTGYQAIRVDDSPTGQLTARPAYTIVRMGEAVITILATGVFIVTIGTLPDEPCLAWGQSAFRSSELRSGCSFSG